LFSIFLFDLGKIHTIKIRIVRRRFNGPPARRGGGCSGVGTGRVKLRIDYYDCFYIPFLIPMSP
jgi:hypothetical protein